MANRIYSFDQIPLGQDLSSFDATKVVEKKGAAYLIENGVEADRYMVADGDGNALFAIDELPRTSPHSNTTAPGVGIADDNGNIVVEFSHGKVNSLFGKRISFLGDSITTYNGYMPEGYATYYPHGDINRGSKTWWKQLLAETGMNLATNASWSGSKISGNSQDSTGETGCSDARVQALASGEVDPNIIVVFIGTNDFAANVACGDFSWPAQRPSEGVITSFAQAYLLLLYKLHETYPDADVYCCTLLPRIRTSGTPETYVNSNGDTIYDYNEVIRKTASAMNCEVIDLNTCGLNDWNLSLYCVDGRLHPNAAGAVIIKNAARIAIESSNDK